jgi:hypothetical protein
MGRVVSCGRSVKVAGNVLFLFIQIVIVGFRKWCQPRICKGNDLQPLLTAKPVFLLLFLLLRDVCPSSHTNEKSNPF